MLVHSLVAQNDAVESENKIHEDSVARQYGFAGGLVPGVTVYAYLTWPAVERWGQQWLDRGAMSARFASPVYDGETVEVHSHDRDGVLHVEARNPKGEVCATATASLPDDPAEPFPRRTSPRSRCRLPTPDLPPQRTPCGRCRSGSSSAAGTPRRRPTISTSCPMTCRCIGTRRWRTQAGCCAPRTPCCRSRCALVRGSTSRASASTTDGSPMATSSRPRRGSPTSSSKKAIGSSRWTCSWRSRSDRCCPCATPPSTGRSPRMPLRTASLRHSPAFVRWAGAEGVDALGSAVTAVVLPILVFQRTDSRGLDSCAGRVARGALSALRAGRGTCRRPIRSPSRDRRGQRSRGCTDGDDPTGLGGRSAHGRTHLCRRAARGGLLRVHRRSGVRSAAAARRPGRARRRTES